MKAPKLMATVLLAVTLALAAPASAVFYYFDNITNNIAGDAAIGEAQLSMDVTALGMNQVLFTFFNSGPAASSITDIYFEDGALLGIASILDTPPDVAFSQIDVAPPDLPGGGAVGFNTTSGFSADSDAPVMASGVNPGESVGIVFYLQAGKTFNNVIADLNSLDLRVGIHVQGFATGGSESFVNTPIPEPTTLLVLGLGLAGLGALRARRKTK